MSPRLGIMSLGWAITRHNKGVKNGIPDKFRKFMWCLISAMFWLHESGKFKSTQNIATFDVLGVCISISVHTVDRCVRDCTYRRGLRCCLFEYKGNTRACEAEQQQCSPAFLLKSGAAFKLTTAFFVSVYEYRI